MKPWVRRVAQIFLVAVAVFFLVPGVLLADWRSIGDGVAFLIFAWCLPPARRPPLTITITLPEGPITPEAARQTSEIIASRLYDRTKRDRSAP